MLAPGPFFILLFRGCREQLSGYHNEPTCSFYWSKFHYVYYIQGYHTFPFISHLPPTPFSTLHQTTYPPKTGFSSTSSKPQTNRSSHPKLQSWMDVNLSPDLSLALARRSYEGRTWNLDHMFYYQRRDQFGIVHVHCCHGQTLPMDSASQTRLSIEEHAQPRDEG